MALLDNAASAFLGGLTSVLQEQYHDAFLDQIFWQGNTTNSLIPVAEEGELEVVSDGINFQVESGLPDAGRGSTNPLSDFPISRNFTANNIKARFSEDTTAGNDFWTYNTAAQVTHHAMISASKGKIVDEARRIFTQVTQGYQQSLAMHRNMNRTARIAVVSGAPKKNDAQTFVNAGAVVVANGIRVQISSGSISMLFVGAHVDIISAAGAVHAGNLVVSDFNADVDDNSVGLEWVTTGTDISTGDVTTVVDTDEIFFNGERNQGMFSFEEWFTPPATAGDVFIGGLDRALPANRYLLPVSMREGMPSVQITTSHLNDLGDSVRFVRDVENEHVIFRGDLRLVSSLRQRLDANSIVQLPPRKDGKREFTFGALGTSFQHPSFGISTIVGDPLAVPNSLRLMVPEDWKSLWWGWRGIEFMPGDGGANEPWYRPPADTGVGRGKVWRADAWAHALDMCLRPRRQGQILNVTA